MSGTKRDRQTIRTSTIVKYTAYGLVLFVIACPPLNRLADPTDRGDQLVAIRDPDASGDARAKTYSIRAYQEWFGLGRTCVGVFLWRTSGRASYRKWRNVSPPICDDGGVADDSGWRTGRVQVELAHFGHFAAAGVVPAAAAKVRVTRVEDGVSHEEPTVRLDGREGTFFALYRDGFLRSVDDSPPAVRVTLLDGNGRELPTTR